MQPATLECEMNRMACLWGEIIVTMELHPVWLCHYLVSFISDYDLCPVKIVKLDF